MVYLTHPFFYLIGRDTAGQERFRSLIPSYIRDSSVAVIVYDVSSKYWFSGIDLKFPGKIWQVSTEEGEAKAREFGVMFIETSAKAGFNIK
ncbi:hypothetical protein B296_00053619, partial [Ensete ventricosum]